MKKSSPWNYWRIFIWKVLPGIILGLGEWYLKCLKSSWVKRNKYAIKKAAQQYSLPLELELIAGVS